MEKQLEPLLIAAIAKRSTDIHIQIDDHRSSVMFRSLKGLIDYPVSSDLADLYEFCKYKANLDLSMNMIPQTGSFEFVIRKHKYHLRFSAIETYYSRSGVLRILNLHKADRIRDLTSQDVDAEFEKLSMFQYGLILFSGSTGSGKSTTMFTWLKSLIHRRIYTIEDPIEQIFEKFMQVQVNGRQGLSFDEAVFQLLRHDPDIIVIGEIRGSLEAKAAIRSAYSGHLVVATIHSATTRLTIQRLMDFGVSESDISQVLCAVVHQQLCVSSDKKGRGALFDFAFHK